MQSIQPTIRKLNSAGIGAILDYAAENDVHSEKGVAGADSLSEQNYEVRRSSLQRACYALLKVRITTFAPLVSLAVCTLCWCALAGSRD